MQHVFQRRVVGRIIGIEEIAAVIVLDPVAERIEPVIENLARDGVAADAPGMPVALSLEMLVADEQGVDVGDLEGDVPEPGFLRPDAQMDVLIDEFLAPVDPVEDDGQFVRICCSVP